eukprot:TRINITY_DN3270_c0_g1_i2.p1 TRINITY_DN3270_c0_g1~~TRINITY_DN3270_c0_g1_i2.p1  ORF type:complete len:139 (-),score=23.49 TRINITY_DN3270_c0_g1_i2:202-573(-)
MAAKEIVKEDALIEYQDKYDFMIKKCEGIYETFMKDLDAIKPEMFLGPGVDMEKAKDLVKEKVDSMKCEVYYLASTECNLEWFKPTKGEKVESIEYYLENMEEDVGESEDWINKKIEPRRSRN